MEKLSSRPCVNCNARDAEIERLRFVLSETSALLEKTRRERDAEQDEVVEARRERNVFAAALKVIALHGEPRAASYAREALAGEIDPARGYVAEMWSEHGDGKP